MRTALSFVVGSVLALAAPSAFAQGDSQGGTGDASGTAGGSVEAGGSAGLPAPTVAPPAAPAPAPAAATVTTPAADPDAKADDGITDHERVVGKFGVGYLGLTQLPIGTGAPANVGRAVVDAPVIGVRYWLMEKLGLDIGLGFSFFSSGREVEQNNTTTSVDGPAVFGLALHGGVPLVFAHAKHYKFLLIPEFNVGFASRTEKQTGNPAPPDISRSGFRLDVGARVGSEIHFGFIGVPQLALQATVGLGFRRLVWKNSQDAGPGVPTPQSSSDGETALGTTVQSDPWALFVNNISAIYYFP